MCPSVRDVGCMCLCGGAGVCHDWRQKWRLVCVKPDGARTLAHQLLGRRRGAPMIHACMRAMCVCAMSPTAQPLCCTPRSKLKRAPVRCSVQRRDPVLVGRIGVRTRLQQLLPWLWPWFDVCMRLLGGQVEEQRGGTRESSGTDRPMGRLTPTTLSWPFPAAQCRGVYPALSCCVVGGDRRWVSQRNGAMHVSREDRAVADLRCSHACVYGQTCACLHTHRCLYEQAEHRISARTVASTLAPCLRSSCAKSRLPFYIIQVRSSESIIIAAAARSID